MYLYSIKTNKNVDIMTTSTKNSKRQTRKIGVAGGFINQLMGNNSTIPVVGQGATILSYSDRHAYEVTEVSEDGLKCVIRAMECEFIGESYGDERYSYKSNEANHTSTIEWNEKKQCWGKTWNQIEVIKSLQNKLVKEFSYNWSENLPNGLKYDDIIDIEASEETCMTHYKLVKGVTKEYKNFSKISIIFGVMEQYRDPSF